MCDLAATPTASKELHASIHGIESTLYTEQMEKADHHKNKACLHFRLQKNIPLSQFGTKSHFRKNVLLIQFNKFEQMFK